MARLANIVTIWIKTCVALELAATPLQFHDHIISVYNSKVALCARSIAWAGTLQAFGSACGALFVNHVGKFVIRAIIDACRTLQEETVLTFLTLWDECSSAFCAIGMTLDAHCKLGSGTSNTLHRIEVAIFTITDNEGILAIVYAVSWWIENLARGTSQALHVRWSIAFGTPWVTRFAIHCSWIIIESRFARAVSHGRAVYDRKTCNSCTERASLDTTQINSAWSRLSWNIAPTAEWVASRTGLICRVLILILVAYSSAFTILSTNWALGLSHLLLARGLNHLRYLVDAHSMLEYSKLLENKAAIRKNTHGIGRVNHEVTVSIGTICCRCQTFHVSHIPQTATKGRTYLVSVDTDGKVLPSVILKKVCVSWRLLLDIFHRYDHTVACVWDFEAKVYNLGRGGLYSVYQKRKSFCSRWV